MKVFLYIGITIALINTVTAQTRGGSTTNRARINRNRSSNGNDNEPIEEGRTLGVIRPLLGFGLNTLTRPLAAFGLDEPIAPSRPYRPIGSGLVGATQSDPYYGYGGGGGGQYGGYGGYGGLLSNIFGGYPNYGGYQQQYRPQYGGFNGGYPPYIVGSYRPQQYRPQAFRPIGIFGGFNGYPSNNAYGGQQGSFGGQQFGGQQPGISATNGPSAPGLSSPSSRPGVGGSQIDPAQAAQVANLLGQLLGSQLRPLLSQGGGASASDVPGVSPSRLAG